jgi:hypothetical protein
MKCSCIANAYTRPFVAAGLSRCAAASSSSLVVSQVKQSRTLPRCIPKRTSFIRKCIHARKPIWVRSQEIVGRKTLIHSSRPWVVSENHVLRSMVALFRSASYIKWFKQVEGLKPGTCYKHQCLQFTANLGPQLYILTTETRIQMLDIQYICKDIAISDEMGKEMQHLP